MNFNQHNFVTTLKENLIYFATLLVCIALFYGFVSVGDINNPLVQGNKKFDFTMYAPMIRYCIYSVSIAIFILVSYVNSNMFKEKLKEMSVLITLGMQRSKIAIWYSRDILKVSILSFIFGIILGIACSFVINAIVSIIAYGNIGQVHFFYINSFLETLLFFSIMYLGMTFINIIKVMSWKPIDLLNNEKVPDSKRNSVIRKVIELTLLPICYFFIGYNINVYFSLGRNYNGSIPNYESNKFQFAIFVAIIIAIYLTIRIINYLLFWLKSNKYIRNKVMAIVIGKLSHRMQSNTRNMLLITIVLTLSLCGFSLIPLMAEFSKEYMEHRMVYDVNIPFNYDNIENINDIPDIDYNFVKKIFIKNNIELMEDCILEEYFIWDSDFVALSERKNRYDMPRLAIGISDYNQLRHMAGLEIISLEKNCFIFHVKDDIDLAQFQDALDNENIRAIKVANTILKENPNHFLISENLGDYIYNTNTDSFLVFPDDICASLKIAKKCYFANTKEKIPYRICKNTDQQIQDTFYRDYKYLYSKYENVGNQAIDFIGPIRFRSIEENDISFMAIITKSLGMYIGIVFMLICIAIISIKNIIECNTNIDDYFVLHQIGMPINQVKSINLIENVFFYLFPYLISILNFCIVQNTFILRFGKRAETYFHGNEYINGIIIPVIIISLILLLYIISVQVINYHKITQSFENKVNI